LIYWCLNVINIKTVIFVKIFNLHWLITCLIFFCLLKFEDFVLFWIFLSFCIKIHISSSNWISGVKADISVSIKKNKSAYALYFATAESKIDWIRLKFLNVISCVLLYNFFLLHETRPKLNLLYSTNYIRHTYILNYIHSNMST